MHRVGLLAALSLAAIAYIPRVNAATFSINPMSFELLPDRTSSVMQVSNNGVEPVRLQVQIMSWSTDGKNEVLTETDQIMINPPLFTLQPKQTQYIRFGARKLTAEPIERSYRILLDEVDVPTAQRGGITTLLRISSPIFIPPEVKRESVMWSLRRAPNGAVLSASNQGNCHLKISSLKLLAKNAAQPVFSAGLTYLLPGQTREWVLPTEKNLSNSLMLELQTPSGNHEQNLAFSAP